MDIRRARPCTPSAASSRREEPSWAGRRTRRRPEMREQPPIDRGILFRRLARVTAGMSGRDARLAVASRGFARTELQEGALLEGSLGESSLASPNVVEARRRHVDALCGCRAHTLEGHRARALAFCIWDDGELPRRVAARDLLEDRLLWAILSDLASG